jgi:hypothetical protein
MLPLFPHLSHPMRWSAAHLLTVATVTACNPPEREAELARQLDTVCIAFEDAYVIAEGDTVTEEHARDFFDRADAICEATASFPDPVLPEDA